MHQLLENKTILTIGDILKEEHLCRQIFEDYGCLPTRNLIIKCADCGKNMSIRSATESKLKWLWICIDCDKTINPTIKTYFHKSKLTFSDTLAMVTLFLDKEGIVKGRNELVRL